MQSPARARTRGLGRALFVCLGLSILLAVFPVASGVIAVVGEADPVTARWWQGLAMLASLVPLGVYGWFAGGTPRAWGVRGLRRDSAAAAWWFLPLVVAKVGFLAFGVTLDFIALASMAFMALAVGVAEELYFRGAILSRLRESLSTRIAVVVSAAFFAVVHVAQAFAGTSPLLVLLSVVNALLFGWVAAELVVITASLLPVIVWHAAFDFVNWASLVEGQAEVGVTVVQSLVLVTYGALLWRRLPVAA